MDTVKSESKKKRRVCVGLAQLRDAQETGPMFREALEELGHKAWVTYPWDKSFLEADVLLLLGSFYKFSDFGTVLLNHSGKKPVTILWQSDPLPPVSLSAKAEKIGLQLGGLDWGRLGLRNSRLIRRFIPLSGKACRVARWIFCAMPKKRNGQKRSRQI